MERTVRVLLVAAVAIGMMPILLGGRGPAQLSGEEVTAPEIMIDSPAIRDSISAHSDHTSSDPADGLPRPVGTPPVVGFQFALGNAEAVSDTLGEASFTARTRPLPSRQEQHPFVPADASTWEKLRILFH
jgi:hypothetical protein